MAIGLSQIYDFNRDVYLTTATTGIGAQQAYNNAMMAQQQRAMSAYDREQQMCEYDMYLRQQVAAAKQALEKVEAREPVLAFMDNTKTKVLLTEGE